MRVSCLHGARFGDFGKYPKRVLGPVQDGRRQYTQTSQTKNGDHVTQNVKSLGVLAKGSPPGRWRVDRSGSVERKTHP